ncbi:hypothetical protein DXG01_016288 [Tephrocybe rancida]|nr:hypothetical protein DXG01_016288 [Tephrocybe rancida]
MCLKEKGRVLITSGDLLGMTGTISLITESTQEATIHIEVNEIIMDVSINLLLLRKDVRIGDRVCVVGGRRDGVVGWVVAVNEDDLHLWEDVTATHEQHKENPVEALKQEDSHASSHLYTTRYCRSGNSAVSDAAHHFNTDPCALKCFPQPHMEPFIEDAQTLPDIS